MGPEWGGAFLGPLPTGRRFEYHAELRLEHSSLLILSYLLEATLEPQPMVFFPQAQDISTSFRGQTRSDLGFWSKRAGLLAPEVGLRA